MAPHTKVGPAARAGGRLLVKTSFNQSSRQYKAIWGRSRCGRGVWRQDKASDVELTVARSGPAHRERGIRFGAWSYIYKSRVPLVQQGHP